MKPVVLHIITGLEDAGAEKILFNIVTNDTRAIHNVVSLGGPGKYGPMMEALNIKPLYLNITPKSFLSNLITLKNHIQNIQPDCVQTWMYEADVYGGIAAKMAGIKNIHWSLRFSHVDLKSISKPMKWAIKASPSLSKHIPTSIISCAHTVKDYHIKSGWDPKQWHVVHNGYDFKKMTFHPEQRTRVRASLGLAPDVVLFGMVARCDPQKDHTTLLSSFASVCETYPDDAYLVLIGRGCDTDETLTQQIKERHIEDRVIRLPSQPDVENWYSAIDIHILVSRFGEGFPNVVAESMACGCTSISTNSGDAPYILEENTQNIVPMGDEIALEKAMKTNYDVVRKQTKRNTQRYINSEIIKKKYSIDKMISGFHKAWGLTS
jgi:glycosyltransferase involved in cell wall biosynthesis